MVVQGGEVAVPRDAHQAGARDRGANQAALRGDADVSSPPWRTVTGQRTDLTSNSHGRSISAASRR